MSIYNLSIVAVSKYDWNNAEVGLKLISLQSCWQQSFLSSVFNLDLFVLTFILAVALNKKLQNSMK